MWTTASVQRTCKQAGRQACKQAAGSVETEIQSYITGTM